MSDYRELIKRLEKATGRDYGIDLDLACEFGPFIRKRYVDENGVAKVAFFKRDEPIKGQWAFASGDDTAGSSWVFLSTPAYTASIDAAVALVEKMLPGWWITCGLCSLTGHASIGPDYNGPHRDRLLRDFPPERFDHGGFDADLPPGDGLHRVCYAILHCLLHALEAQQQEPEA